MATYQQIIDMHSDAGFSNLVQKIEVAIAIKAHAVAVAPTPPASEIAWAKSALQSPRAMANQVVHYVIAANIGATTNQILAATDAVIQGNVNEAVEKLFGV